MVKCSGCDGTGKIPLFTSQVDCTRCKGKGQVLSDEEREKQRLLCEYLKTPEGRRKLSAAMMSPRRGARDYPRPEG